MTAATFNREYAVIRCRSAWKPFSVRLVLAAALLFLAWGQDCASAGELAKPSGQVLLTVSGAIANTNAGDKAEFDRAMLEALGMQTITTGTPWHEHGTRFTGVPVKRVLEAVGASGKMVHAVAANDYAVAIPAEDFEAYRVLLATHINNKELRLRTKGPIWVIYPDDTDLAETIRTERMIWQLVALRVE